MNDLTWRKAVPGDAAECIALRARTRENAFTEAQLRALGITVESWDDGIRDGLFSGHVCCVHGRMVGYCFGDTGSGEIVVLAMLPEYEGAGIGKRLLRRVIDDFAANGFTSLFLGCSPDRRLSPIGLSFFRHPSCGNTAWVYRDCSDNFESRSIPGNHRYLASCIYKIIRWQCRHASCRLRASVQTVRAWRMPAIHGAQSRKSGSQLPVPFKPCVVLSILEIDPCQRIPVEKPAD
ncbi:TPA: GNAT family N-acetyltransferase [Burkholderia cenocepacia]